MSVEATNTRPTHRHARREAGRTCGNSKKRNRTRKAQLITMLSRKAGADVGSISEAFGWQPHTTRAALSGLRKAGYDLIREGPRAGKPARYRIPKTSITNEGEAVVKRTNADAR